jgi:hypothetical protein
MSDVALDVEQTAHGFLWIVPFDSKRTQGRGRRHGMLLLEHADLLVAG